MDNWQSGSSLAMLQGRAELLLTLRQFFFQRSVMEVDVPVMARSSVTDINIESISAKPCGGSGYLQTSPEYFMKRLLAAGSGDIYCLGKAFRDDDDLRVAIIIGGGEKFFCPGWDLKAAADGDEVDGDYGVGGFGGMQEMRGLNKPIIAAVNGICCAPT